MQDDILAGDVLRQAADQIKLDCGRYLEPCGSGCHAGCEVGRTDTSGECAQCAVGTGVGVRADNQLTRTDQTFFRQERVLDAHRADVKEIDDFMLAGKRAALQALLGGLDVLVRCKVIHDQCDLGLVKYRLKAGLLQLADCNRTGDIVCQRQIQLCFDQLAGRNTVETRMLCEDLLCHRHSHIRCTPFLVV